MLPSTLWQKELAETFASKRSLAIKLAFPLALAGPVIIASPPPAVTAGAVAFLVLFVGVFGSAVGLAQERREGIWQRVMLTPHSPGRLLAEVVLANAAVDLLQLSPVFAIFLLRFRPSTPWLVAVLVGGVAATLVAGLLGVLLASAVEGSGEVHLYAAVLVFALAGLSGLFFPLRAENAWQVAVARASPFTYLAQALLGAEGGPALFGPLDSALSLGLLSAGLLGVALLAAPRLLRLRD
ncbi:MAG: ABC transporter permease [Chloroflexota bacterium]